MSSAGTLDELRQIAAQHWGRCLSEGFNQVSVPCARNSASGYFDGALPARSPPRTGLELGLLARIAGKAEPNTVEAVVWLEVPAAGHGGAVVDAAPAATTVKVAPAATEQVPAPFPHVPAHII